MNPIISKILVEQATGVAAKAADGAVTGTKDVVTKFAGNYTKRRNVGFGIVQSGVGAFKDTRRYYSDVLTGKEPVEMIEAISFEPENFTITTF